MCELRLQQMWLNTFKIQNFKPTFLVGFLLLIYLVNCNMLLNNFIALLYPDLCLVCGNNLLKHEEYICITCLHKTPKTNCFKQRENEVSKIFQGRSKLENAAALFTFNKDGNAQKLIHTLKYEEGGEMLGFSQGNNQVLQ